MSVKIARRMGSLSPFLLTPMMVNTYFVPGSSPVRKNSGLGAVEVLARTLGAASFLPSSSLVPGLELEAAGVTERVKVCASPPSQPAWHRTEALVEVTFSTVQLLTGSGVAVVGVWWSGRENVGVR